jgi:hypothetical protein
VAFLFKQWDEWAPFCEMLKADYQPLYRSNRKASEDEDRGVIDERYGHTCAVPTGIVGINGSLMDIVPGAFAVGRKPCRSLGLARRPLAGTPMAARRTSSPKWAPDEHRIRHPRLHPHWGRTRARGPSRAWRKVTPGVWRTLGTSVTQSRYPMGGHREPVCRWCTRQVPQGYAVRFDDLPF